MGGSEWEWRGCSRVRAETTLSLGRDTHKWLERALVQYQHAGGFKHLKKKEKKARAHIRSDVAFKGINTRVLATVGAGGLRGGHSYYSLICGQ